MVGTLGDVVPGTYQGLELRERRVNLPGHGSLLGFFPDDVDRQLSEVAEHWNRELEDLDRPLELRLQPLKSDCVLGVMLREAVHLDGCGGMVEHPPEIDRERLVRLLVEAEVE